MNTHRVRLEFEPGDGVVGVSLICPETGCEPVTMCGACGRYFDDKESGTCESCEIELETTPACWLAHWFDAMGTTEACEWLQGEVTIEVNGIFEDESPVIEVYEPDRELAALTWPG